MSWKKRPTVIKQTLESVLIPYNIGMDEIVAQEDRGELAPGVDKPEIILTGDLSYS